MSIISTWTRLAASELVNTADLIAIIDVSAGASGSKTMAPADLMQSAPGLTHCIVGYNAARSITSGTYVHAFGYHALYNLTSGAADTAVGRQAGYAVTSAQSCVFVGAYAGWRVTTGNGNTAVGADSLGGATTGAYNTAVGQTALYTGAAGQTECVAVGASALYSDTGNQNTAVGNNALFSKGAGSKNVAIGRQAARYSDLAGTTAVTSCDNSIYIGENVRAGGATGDSNSIVIGYLALGKGANTTVIGSSSTTLAKVFGAHRLANTSAPSGETDCCEVYSADQAAGNACPHVRTENGAILKLFQSAAAIANATDLSTVITSVNSLLAHVRAMGVIPT